MQNREQGSMMTGLLFFIVAFAIIGLAVGSMIVSTLNTVVRTSHSEQAFNVSEAGINYYLWHLNHDSADQKDGTGAPASQGTYGFGPYTHDYWDLSGNKVGKFTLWIKPGASGSTTVTVRSIGEVTTYPRSIRTIEARIGAPSFSTYAMAGNTALWFGNTESTSGKIHSNIGIKMDGANTDQVSSARATYTVPSWSGSGAGTTKPGVWCDSSVTNPVNCNTRNKTSWTAPVPAVDFNKVAGDLCTLKKIAINDNSATACNSKPARTASYIPAVSATSYSATVGYLITLNDNGTYNLEKVTNEKDTNSTYASALTRTTIANNIAVPPSGVVFVEDNVWLRTAGPNGFDGRITIASARLAMSGDTSAVIASSLKYKDKYSGNDAIGVVAEDDVEVAPYAGAPVEIDAALIAQMGSVGIRRQYNGTTNYVDGYALSNQALSFFGSIASNQEWTWSVMLCGTPGNANCWAGYRYTSTVYDENLRYSPPPSFPVTSSFDLLSWREVMTNP